MKKAFDQTFRDIKREVNKKVLKVPGIEQKVLDATSNEPWGPHGLLLADIAQASRNYHEYHIIMSVIWKRVNDTGKNWRHVYKALTVLEYLIAHGIDRVVDEIKEHVHQLSTLSDFQYIDSSGRDQGNNVRKKSQSLVVLVNDKGRIQEVRQKAASNRDKLRSSSMGNVYRSGNEGYGDDDDDRYAYGRYSDHYGRRSFEDDGQYSARGSGTKANDHSREGRRLDRMYSEQNLGAPPSYEEAMGEVQRSPVHSERGEEQASVSTTTASPRVSEHVSVARSSSTPPAPISSTLDFPDPSGDGNGDDLHGSVAPGTPPVASSNGDEMDFLGSLSDVFSSNALALVTTSTSEVDSFSNSAIDSSQSPSTNQKLYDDPFGDGPFKALPHPSTGINSTSSTNQNSETPKKNSFSSFSYPSSSNVPNDSQFLHQDMSSSNQDTDILADILPLSSSGFPQSVPGFSSQDCQPESMAGYPNEGGQVPETQGFSQPMFMSGFNGHHQSSQSGFPAQNAQHGLYTSFAPPGGQHQQPPVQLHTNYCGTNQQQSGGLQPPNVAFQQSTTNQSLVQFGNHSPTNQSLAQFGNLTQQPVKEFETKSTVWTDTLSRGLVNLNISGPKTNPLSDIGIDFAAMNRKEKRMEKPTTNVTTTVTMGKAMGTGSGMGRAGAGGLMPQSNPMMGSGSGSGPGSGMGMGARPGMGMDGYGGMNQPMSHMGGIGMGMNAPANMGMGMNAPANMGMGMNAPANMGMGMNAHANMGMGMNAHANMGMGMNAPMNMGMGMNVPMNMGMNAPMNMGMNAPMNMGQGTHMQPTGFLPRTTMPDGYNNNNNNNPMMGSGGYVPQQPYRGGYQ